MLSNVQPIVVTVISPWPCLQFLIFNEEFLVSAGHELALTMWIILQLVGRHSTCIQNVKLIILGMNNIEPLVQLYKMAIRINGIW